MHGLLDVAEGNLHAKVMKPKAKKLGVAIWSSNITWQ